LFSFSLKDKAKLWLNSLRPRSIGMEGNASWIFEKILPH
jgi:hypothetical protein